MGLLGRGISSSLAVGFNESAKKRWNELIRDTPKARATKLRLVEKSI
jgi:hypothetical protein